MKTSHPLWIALVLAGLATACSGFQRSGSSDSTESAAALAAEKQEILSETQAQNEEMLREFHEDAVQFLNETGDAFFNIGYEYYSLAKEAEQVGDKDRAERYARLSKMYYEHYDKLKSAAQGQKAALQAGAAPPAPTAPGGASRPSVAPGGSVSGVGAPEEIRVVPPEEPSPAAPTAAPTEPAKGKETETKK
ncbi:MAG: hypothetical protein NTW86_27380 [Candidatus Sumerlaeota bacterium]|nr:hypothetical protein [Candidatus Sumerlaeota bacterium]